MHYLKFWLMGFMLGQFFGRTTDAIYAFFHNQRIVLVVLIVATLWIGYRLRLIAVAVIVTGMLWGASHSVPMLDYPSQGVRIVIASFPFDFPGSNIAQLGSGYVEVKGSGLSPEQYGSVKCKDRISLFANKICFFKSELPRLMNPSVLVRFVFSCRAFLEERVKSYSPMLQSWLKGIVIGDLKLMPPHLSTLFKDLGLYHLLVVSGHHVTLAAIGLEVSLKFPLILLYAARCLSPVVWIRSSVYLEILTAVLAFTYSLAVGMAASCQRAVLLFLCLRLAPVFFGRLTFFFRFLIAAFLQTVFFPRGLLCEASVMSWAGYLFLSAAVDGSKEHPLLTGFNLNAKLAVLGAACFGQFCGFGILLNPIVAPFFPLLLSTAVYLVGFGASQSVMTSLVVRLHEGFLATLCLIHEKLGESSGFLAKTLNFHFESATLLHQVAVLASIYFLLNTFMNVSIANERSSNGSIVLEKANDS